MKKILLFIQIVSVLLIAHEFRVVQSGPPQRLLALFGDSQTAQSIAYFYPTQDTVTYQYIAELPTSYPIAYTGNIVTPKNSTSFYFPSYNSENETSSIILCNIETNECVIEAYFTNLKITSMNYDSKTKELFFVALNSTIDYTNNEISIICGATLLSRSQIVTSYHLISQINNVGVKDNLPLPECTLGPLSFYVLWFDAFSQSSNGFYFNRTSNLTSSVVQFTPSSRNPTSPFIPTSMIYNFNSLTNITSLCVIPFDDVNNNNGDQTLSVQLCSPNFHDGTTQLPFNAHIWNYAVPTSISADEVGGFSNYYYSVLREYETSDYYLWVLNAADGWTISNSTIPNTNQYSLWSLAALPSSK